MRFQKYLESWWKFKAPLLLASIGFAIVDFPASYYLAGLFIGVFLGVGLYQETKN